MMHDRSAVYYTGNTIWQRHPSFTQAVETLTWNVNLASQSKGTWGGGTLQKRERSLVEGAFTRSFACLGRSGASTRSTGGADARFQCEFLSLEFAAQPAWYSDHATSSCGQPESAATPAWYRAPIHVLVTTVDRSALMCIELCTA